MKTRSQYESVFAWKNIIIDFFLSITGRPKCHTEFVLGNFRNFLTNFFLYDAMLRNAVIDNYCFE